MDEELEESDEIYIPEIESPLAPATPLCNEMLGVAIEALHLAPDYLDFLKRTFYQIWKNFVACQLSKNLKNILLCCKSNMLPATPQKQAKSM